MKLRKGLAALLCAVLFTASGCGGSTTKTAADPNLGMYTCRDVYMNDMSAGANGEYIELKQGNKLSIKIGDNPYDGEYKLDGENFTLVMFGEDDSTGTLKDGVLTLDMSGMKYIFVKEGMDYSAAPTDETGSAGGISFGGTPAPAGSTDQAAASADWTPEEIWHGRWIGSMYMDNAKGTYTDYEGRTITAVANCDAQDGRDYFDVYLPENGYSEDDNSAFLSMYIKMDKNHFEIDDTDGWVTDMTISKDDYSDYYVIFIENHGNLISFTSSYVSPDNAADSFDFTLEMRKNGSIFDDNYDSFPISVYDSYQNYKDYLYSDTCTVNVVDGTTGEVLIDRGNPVYVPGVAKQAAAAAVSSAPEATASSTDTGSGSAEYEEIQNGRLTSLNGYFSMEVPSGWDYEGIELDSNQIYVNKDDVQINVQLDYLNGYTVQEMAHQKTYSSVTYDYDTTIPEGTATVDGRTFYTVGPLVDFGNLYYYLIGEWKKDPTMYVKFSVEIFSTEDKSKMAPVLAGDAYKKVFSTLKINDQ